MEKIKMGSSIVQQLEMQEIVASGEELAKTRHLIKEKSRTIVENIKNLNDSLNNLYIKNSS